ncbi:Uma2 family endonuclease [Gloeomargaritales cyanobacterium VI4D9]|nr:Uma2 family endonuclease [Gloeomargaritales cyanobacterium VI4D9]
MTVSIPLKCISLREGSTITLHSQTWQDWENIVEELGEDRHTRIAYYQGTLEIMSPLSRHERPHRIIGDIIKAILDAQGRDWEDFGSTTFYRKDRAGVEPDTCFYVTNASLVRDCMERIDVDIYPPPDLAIESDATSKTFLSAYEAIAVPEIWIYHNNSPKIFLLSNGQYSESESSLLFPDLPVKTLIPQLVKQGMAIGASAMLREFR